MKRNGGDSCGRVDGYFGAFVGGPSGGTIESILNLFSLPINELMKLGDPYYLNLRTTTDGTKNTEVVAGPSPKSGVADRAGVW